MAWSMIRDRGVLRAKLLVPGRQLRVVPPQLLLEVRLYHVPRPRQLQLVPRQSIPVLLNFFTIKFYSKL